MSDGFKLFSGLFRIKYIFMAAFAIHLIILKMPKNLGFSADKYVSFLNERPLQLKIKHIHRWVPIVNARIDKKYKTVKL